VTGRTIERFNQNFGAAVAGICVLTGLAGCAGDFKVHPPHMPTMGATPPAAMTVTSPNEALAAAAAAANHDDLPAVVRAFDSLPPDERSSVVRELMTAIAGQDLARAERVAEALPTGSMQTAAIEILARAMVDHDAGAALRWPLTTASPAMKLSARSAVAERLMEGEAKSGGCADSRRARKKTAWPRA